MDLAMTKLFGGFDRTFYEAYQDYFPLESGIEDRFPVQQLYALLVHVNLFGGSYAAAVLKIINKVTWFCIRPLTYFLRNRVYVYLPVAANCIHRKWSFDAFIDWADL